MLIYRYVIGIEEINCQLVENERMGQLGDELKTKRLFKTVKVDSLIKLILWDMLMVTLFLSFFLVQTYSAKVGDINRGNHLILNARDVTILQ